MAHPFVAENDAERQRLKALTERLSDEQLARPIDDGWTIAGVLAHMAFWDARALYLIDKWEGGTAPSPDDWERDDVEWINASAKWLCLALAPRAAARLALYMAEQADLRVAGLSEALVQQNMAAGQPLRLERALHRREHLDEIERQLGTK